MKVLDARKTDKQELGLLMAGVDSESDPDSNADARSLELEEVSS
jgi:hypothetical protein